MKLTLLQYLKARQTGHYPESTGTTDRELTENEQSMIRHHRTGRIKLLNENGFTEVYATSLIENPPGTITGIFQDAQGRICAGCWQEESRAFTGMRLPLDDIQPVEVEYLTSVAAYPDGARTSPSWESWPDDGALPIYLSNGRPQRHIGNRDACVFTWHPLIKGGMGWIQDSD